MSDDIGNDDRDEDIRARIFIRDPGGLTLEGRQRIADWLIQQAAALVAEGDNYASRFTATYRSPPVP